MTARTRSERFPKRAPSSVHSRAKKLQAVDQDARTSRTMLVSGRAAAHLPTAPDSAWAKEYDDEVLTFNLGGHDIWTLALRAHTLTTPFTKLSPNLPANLPVWEAFPRETQ